MGKVGKYWECAHSSWRDVGKYWECAHSSWGMQELLGVYTLLMGNAGIIRSVHTPHGGCWELLGVYTLLMGGMLGSIGSVHTPHGGCWEVAQVCTPLKSHVDMTPF